jgi:lysophospholipase L1-like esterase
MSPDNGSRRSFVKMFAAGTLSTIIIPEALSDLGNVMTGPITGDKKELTFLFQGDSITDGNRGRNYSDLNHIMGHGYAFSIAGRLGYDFPERNLKFINRGISGNKVTDLAKRWKEDALDLNPDLLSILIGINDTSSVIDNNNPMLTPVTLQKFDDVYRSLLDQSLKKNPGIIFVLNQPFAFRYTSTANNWELRQKDLKEREKIAEKIALDYNAVFVRLQDKFNDACKRAPAEYWIWDGIHPTVAGHELITREWLKEVSKRLKFIRHIA